MRVQQVCHFLTNALVIVGNQHPQSRRDDRWGLGHAKVWLIVRGMSLLWSNQAYGNIVPTSSEPVSREPGSQPSRESS
jgi:hypothetical protein